MAEDKELSARALEVIVRSDQHNWSYQWSWLGLPIIQMPPDIVALQEIIWEHRPKLIIETGVARGGSVIFLSSMLHLLGEGEVIGIDIDIRPHNRLAIEQHPLAHRIQLIEGSSLDPEVVAAARQSAAAVDRVMVILDSNHTHAHVADELELYGPLVTEGQFLVVADTIVEHIPAQTHRPRPWGPGDNPHTALQEFSKRHPEFMPDPDVNSKLLLSSSPGGYLKRHPLP